MEAKCVLSFITKSTVKGCDSHCFQATPLVPPVPKRHRKTGKGSGKDYENDQGVGELVMQTMTEGVGLLTPEKARLRVI